MDFGIAVPICATVSRETGEIRFEYSRDEQDVIRFGRVMTKLGKIYAQGREQETGADAIRGAASEREK